MERRGSCTQAQQAICMMRVSDIERTLHQRSISPVYQTVRAATAYFHPILHSLPSVRNSTVSFPLPGGVSSEHLKFFFMVYRLIPQLRAGGMDFSSAWKAMQGPLGGIFC